MEAKNTEQDQKLAAQGTQLEAVDRDLSRTKEKLADTDADRSGRGFRGQQSGCGCDAGGQQIPGPPKSRGWREAGRRAWASISWGPRLTAW